jgi:hypothetical protein
MPIKRRHFLQAAGSTLAAIGLSQFDITRQGDRYGRLLAQPTARKLALLVGINDYPAGVTPLRGCITDVNMQRELLVHRFGFHPNDILTLTDQQATRQNLLDAFDTHLIQQAQPGDVVVFHFSGHGSLVVDPDPIPIPQGNPYGEVQGYNGTMLPYDARVNLQGNQVNDIMGKTLFLLMSALRTNQVTVMLDSCHSGGGTRGDLRFRAVDSRVALGEAGPSRAELATQEEWMETLRWSAAELKRRRSLGIARGVALGSAQGNQLAADAAFGRLGPGQFHAGAFTYALTRYLWQQPGSLPLERVFIDLARSTRDVARSARLEQVPIYMTEPQSNFEAKPLFFLAPQTPAAEAVILGDENGEVKFWLGGVSSQSLDAFEAGAIFSAIDAQGNELGQIEQTRREGLVGYGVLKGEARALPQPGRLLRERVRGIPNDLTLRLGVDDSLGAEGAEMRSRLTAIRRVEPVAVNGAESPNFLIGRMTEAGLALAAAEGVQNVGRLGSIGLFTPGLVPLRDTFGAPDETVAQAVARLVPQFQLLLAGRILRSVLNSDTSDLKVDVVVQPVQGTTAVGRSLSRGSRSPELIARRPDGAITALQSGTEIAVQVTNRENDEIHVGVLAIGSNGRITVLHPTDWDAPETASRLGRNETLVAPQQTLPRVPNRDYCENPSEDFHLCLRGSGYVEILTIASTSPLRDALRGIQQIAEEKQATRGQPVGLDDEDALTVVSDLLDEVDRNTRGDVDVRGGVRAVDVTKMAALSTMIQIVD